MAELDVKIDAAAGESYYPMVELLKYMRKEKLRRSDVVVQYGEALLTTYGRRLGDAVWDVFEQTCIAALDQNDKTLASWCLTALKKQFPQSLRVKRLEGMHFEQSGEYKKASEMYDEILKENPANILVSKRQICILLSRGKTTDAITKLNQLLTTFPMDIASWQQLAELHLSRSCFRQAAFCYEELVLINPLNFWFQSRLAEIYATIGGFSNLKTARKHAAQSIELNNRKATNLRAFLTLLAVTSSLKELKQVKNDPEETELNQRLLTLAHAAVVSHYETNASTPVSDVVCRALLEL